MSPADLSDWSYQELGGFVRSASAVVVVNPPGSNPTGGGMVLFLEIEEDEDLVEFHWSFASGEEASNFGEAEIGHGTSTDLEDAQQACWEAVIEELTANGYSLDEIASGRDRTAVDMPVL